MYDRLKKLQRDFENYGHTYTDEEKDPDTGEDKIVKDPVQVGA